MYTARLAGLARTSRCNLLAQAASRGWGWGGWGGRHRGSPGPLLGAVCVVEQPHDACPRHDPCFSRGKAVAAGGNASRHDVGRQGRSMPAGRGAGCGGCWPPARHVPWLPKHRQLQQAQRGSVSSTWPPSPTRRCHNGPRLAALQAPGTQHSGHSENPPAGMSLRVRLNRMPIMAASEKLVAAPRVWPQKPS